MNACPHCAELEEQVAYLKRELALSLAEDKLARLRRATGLSPTEVAVLLTLYEARGRFCPVYMLDEAGPVSRSEDRNLKHIDVRICRIRKKIGKDAIENSWGRGYRITDLGRLLVEEALESRAVAA